MSGPEPRTNLYATAVNIPEESRIGVIQALNQALADTTDLQSQAKFAHWNVKGYDFYQLHLLFDEIAETLSAHVDMLAERITALGGQAMGTTRIAARTSKLPQPPENAVSEDEYIEWLTDHVAHHANSLRMHIERAAELGDEDTADLFTELSREVDTQLYFLESHLQSQVVDQVPATVGGGEGANQPASAPPQAAGAPMGGQQGVPQAQPQQSGAEWGGGQVAGGGQQMPSRQGVGQQHDQGGAPIPEAAPQSLQQPQGVQQSGTIQR